MIPSLYAPFQHWSDGSGVYIISDTHFADKDCKIMDTNWIDPDEQVEIINKIVHKKDTLIILGDVGNPEYMDKIKAGKKILLLGNHDTRGRMKPYFDEIYDGALFISDKVLLSHEPVYGLTWCLNIHGHDHNNYEEYKEDCKHLNVAANVCDYKPVNLGKLIKKGILGDIKSIHRFAIDKQISRKDNWMANH